MGVTATRRCCRRPLLRRRVLVSDAAQQASHGLGADLGAEEFGERGGEFADGGARTWSGRVQEWAQVCRLRAAAKASRSARAKTSWPLTRSSSGSGQPWVRLPDGEE